MATAISSALPLVSRHRLPSRRLTNLLGFLVCAALLGFGYYLQFGLHLEPCPLCILQRVAIFSTGIIFLLAAVHHPAAGGARVYAILLALAAGTGAAVAARHVWLQYFMPDANKLACGMDLASMLEVLSPWETLRQVLRGTGDCTQINWSFLGLSIPAWALIWLVFLGIVGAERNWRQA
ncbi:MAG: disulfide bond formation protein B [Candidatus Competibacteraceae bacterium]